MSEEIRVGSVSMFPEGERYTVRLDDLELSDDGTWIYAQGQPGRVGIPVGRTVVANGCFDGLHPGHLSLFAHLDTLAYKERLRPIVAINSDKSVKALKGASRPVWPQEVRSFLINHLKWPLTVIIFDEETPQRLMDLLKPKLVLKGAQYAHESVVKWEGSEVATVPMLKRDEENPQDWSTSRLLGDTR